ncbi:transposase family protein [Neorhizobium petrolearium]|uniref:transposase family protein n=1 Tax=Neorhizobium petrolearium TaxID=515361 RepID=UPI003F15E511
MPHCGTVSRRVHSRYPRMLADLPCAGGGIELHLTVRRFVCSAGNCRQKIFAERFGGDVIRPMARRTARLDCLVHHLALALGGRPAARFADRLGFPVSNDTLLRTVRRYDRPAPIPPNVIGIDDWAWRRNHRYGTIIAILNAEGQSHCCPTGNRRAPRPGYSPNSPASPPPAGPT